MQPTKWATTLRHDLERYIGELEQRIASLEARLTVPEPPGPVHVVDGFTFARVGLSQSSSSYVGIVGEVTAHQDYPRVQIRFTLYSAAGAILGTGTVYVDNVETAPRTFDLVVRGATVPEVARIGIQIESSR
jgi:hypothetical protein